MTVERPSHITWREHVTREIVTRSGQPGTVYEVLFNANKYGISYASRQKKPTSRIHHVLSIQNSSQLQRLNVVFLDRTKNFPCL